MKKYIFILMTILLVGSCSFSPTLITDYRPSIEITSETDTLRFTIDPLEDSIWNYPDADTAKITVFITETGGMTAYATEVNWRIEDYSGATRQTGTVTFTSPLKIDAQKADTMILDIDLYGHDAQHIDEEDGIEDSVAHGVMTIEVTFYDERGATYDSRKFYAYIVAVKP